MKLHGFGIEEELRDINMRAAELARKAAGESAYVAGAIGPLGIRIEPYGPTGVDEARDFFREQAQALLDAGVDLFVCETFSNIAEMEQAIAASPRLECSRVDQLTIGVDGRPILRHASDAAQRLDTAGADVIG